MKKFLFISIFAIATIVPALAQSQRPRFGIVPNENNTYTGLSFGYNTIKDVAGSLDTIRLYPGNYVTFVQNTMKDSCVYVIKSNAGAFVGDKIHVVVTNKTVDARHLYFGSGLPKYQPFSFMVTAGDSANTVAAGKSLIANFEFDGSKWVEIQMIK